jgi:tripartite-type tricarboxylate transporter receptor subunit TctC
MQKTSRTAIACCFAVTLALLQATTHAQQAAEFYRGKTIRMIIGSAAGAGYDLTGRLLAEYLGTHIPGNPRFVIENMPGASSLVMTNYLYNSAPRDGTVIGMPASGIMLEPRLHILTRDGGSAKFDLRKFNWIGTPVQDPEVFWVNATTAVKTFSDLTQTPLVVGASSTGADNYTLPLILNRLLGSKLKIVPGYKGQNDIFLAAEHGEVQGNTTGIPNLKIERADWLNTGKIRILAQFGTARIKGLETVPTAAELAKTPEDRDMLLFYALKFKMARTLMAPPGVPDMQMKQLISAFDSTMKDPKFIAEASKLGFDLDPLGSVAVSSYMQMIADAPEPMVDRLARVISTQ